VRLRECADSLQPLDYGTDPGQWGRALREHFPNLGQALDTVSEADAAFGVLKERIEKAVIEARMDASPWTSETFLVRLINTIHALAVQGILGGPFNFDWHELSPGSGSWYLGEPVYDDFQILGGCDPADAEARKRGAFAADGPVTGDSATVSAVRPSGRVVRAAWPPRAAYVAGPVAWRSGESGAGWTGSGRTRSRPRAMDTAAPESSSAATAGRLAISRVACWSGVRWSAERSRTTEGRVAPDTASNSPKSVSAEMITSPELAA
jgi:hypothetical protein